MPTPTVLNRTTMVLTPRGRLAVQLRAAKSAPAYAEVYGSDRGHDPAICRLPVCADC